MNVHIFFGIYSFAKADSIPESQIDMLNNQRIQIHHSTAQNINKLLVRFAKFNKLA